MKAAAQPICARMDGALALLPPLPMDQIPQRIAASAVCLGGHFGGSAKAARVIAGKTYQCLAMGRPVIVGDNPANRELLTHGEDAWMCRPDDPQALADSILRLIGDPELRQKLGETGRKTYFEKAGNRVLQEQICQIVEQMVSSAR
jgi:glycosyltransferase involved in cell wall biosynthesis